MLDDSFFEQLPDDPALAVTALCDAFFQFHNSAKSYQDPNILKQYIQYAALLQVMSKTYSFPFAPPDNPLQTKDYAQQLERVFQGIIRSQELDVSRREFDSAYRHYSSRIGHVFLYEFTEGDIERIQSLINELRDHLTAADRLEEGHRARLLKRLEQLQKELHKKVSDLDRFWGLIGDAGIVLRKLGEDAKPIVDVVTKLVKLIWRVQSHTEGLPSDSPFPRLLAPSENHDDEQD